MSDFLFIAQQPTAVDWLPIILGMGGTLIAALIGAFSGIYAAWSTVGRSEKFRYREWLIEKRINCYEEILLQLNVLYNMALAYAFEAKQKSIAADAKVNPEAYQALKKQVRVILGYADSNQLVIDRVDGLVIYKYLYGAVFYLMEASLTPQGLPFKGPIDFTQPIGGFNAHVLGVWLGDARTAILTSVKDRLPSTELLMMSVDDINNAKDEGSAAIAALRDEILPPSSK
jgi:hypothetical protein